MSKSGLSVRILRSNGHSNWGLNAQIGLGIQKDEIRVSFWEHFVMLAGIPLFPLKSIWIIFMLLESVIGLDEIFDVLPA